MRRGKELVRSLGLLVYRLLPKGRYAVIWGWPDYEDNVLALEATLRDRSLRRVVLLMTDPTAPPPHPLGPTTRRVAKDTLRGRVLFLFARYVFFTHPCFMRSFPPNVTSVNVWHGMPIKTVGLLSGEATAFDTTFVLATSPFWADIVQRSLGPASTPLDVGLPRNDRLFLPRQEVWSALGLDQRDDVDRLVAWLPTYRRSVRGFLTVDGTATDTPFELGDIDPDELNARLARRRAFAVVKPHPMAAHEGERRWSNLLVVDSAWLVERSISLYQLLAATTALISDVSSVTIDYLLLDRPVIHVLPDLDEYRASRGFSVDDVEDVLSGPVVTDFAQLLAMLDRVLDGEDPESDRRRHARALSHRHLDDGATARLVAALDL